ncbi:MAG: DNA primase [Candidatus Aenigmarchaeota archaeon]|nr:DNA primase [Candidatus Aenigmarchaeota archaeon]
MSKLAPTSTKYLIRANIKATGVVEKPDVIGAIFGQTEGILGSELNLRELQRTGKIGRIEVKIKSEQGKSEGTIIIPSSLNSSETALIAATLETIDRIGPCTAVIKLEKVEDAMEDKRSAVISKAQEILKSMMETSEPSIEDVSEQIKESVRSGEITSYQGLPAGPDIETAESIVIVEGRADVLILLKYGVRNAIAAEGTSVPKQLADITKGKETTVFVDGDRGGQLIVTSLLQVAEIDFVARAPEGKEVEELSKKEVFKALRDKITVEQFKLEIQSGKPHKPESSEEKSEPRQPGRMMRPHLRTDRDSYRPRRHESRPYESRSSSSSYSKPVRLKTDQKEEFTKVLDELVGTRAACIFDAKKQLMGRVPVKELSNILRTIENPHTVVFDGKVDFEIENSARRKGVKFLVGMEKEHINSPVAIVSREDLK